MSLSAAQYWLRHKKFLCACPSIGLSLDISRMSFDAAFFTRLAPAMDRAFAAMDQLEAGAIANPDEKRMVRERVRGVWRRPDTGDRKP